MDQVIINGNMFTAAQRTIREEWDGDLSDLV